MDKIFIFGHKMPDTDTVSSAIVMSYIMNTIDKENNYIPRVLGSINNETSFVLDRFNIKCPKYLNDVKVQIRDINYRRNLYVDKTESIKDAYDLMNENLSSGIPIIDKENNNKLVGLITLKEIAKELIDGNRRELYTSYDNILKVLDGEELLRYDDIIEGNILTATYKSTTFLNDVELHNDTILVIGDRHSILEYAVNSGVKLIILVGGSRIKDEHLEMARQNKVNIIKTEKGSFDVGNLLNLANFATKINASDKPIAVRENDYLTDFEEMRSKLSYSNYPVIGNDDKCLGMIRITDVISKKRKKVILVDHNEKSQSVEGLEEADIIEIIDHHRLGTISTTTPINFRNMSVGSTCTILYGLFRQYKIDIPDDMAGLMLSAILSDTLLLKSPTTTEYDRDSVLSLSRQLNLDYNKYGMEMFKAASTIKGKTIDDLIYQDFKTFKEDEYNIGIGQIFMTDFSEIEDDIDKYIDTLNKNAENNNYDILCLFVTDIINNGSYILFNEKARNILSLAYNFNDIPEGYFLQDVVSRKKQMVVAILDVIEGKL